MLMSRFICQTNWPFPRLMCKRVCVFITAGPITKLFAGGGGGEWTTCAMIDDEPRPVWMSPLVTH